MHPILLAWGDLILPAWHTFYVIGAIAALLILLRLGERHAPEIATQDLGRLFAVCYVLGYIGARLLSILVEEPDTSVLQGLVTFGPMTFYGGALAAFAGGGAYAYARKMPFGTICDISLPAGLVALALGRLGCFLNGDDYGKAAPRPYGEAPWWSVTFPVLQDGIARYPVQLLESGLALLLALLLIWRFKALRAAFKPGIVGFLGIVGYANCRFFLEFLRDDFRGSPLGNWMSTSQFISILVVAAAGVTVPFWIAKSRRDAPLRP